MRVKKLSDAGEAGGEDDVQMVHLMKDVEEHEDSNNIPEAPSDDEANDSYVSGGPKERNLLRKLDIHLLLPLTLMTILNSLDRTALPNARVQGLETTLKMTGSQFNTAISIFFRGYIMLQVPSNLLLTRVRPSRYLGGCMLAWGVVSAATGLGRDFGQLVVVRFALGVLEAPFFAGALFLLGSWYTRRELALRMSILYAGSLVSGAFGGIIAAGIEWGMHGVLGVESWRWLFIIEGAITVVVAAFAMKWLPDFPETTKARWLAEIERRLAIDRLRAEEGFKRSHAVSKGDLLKGLKLALKDYKTYLLSAIILTKTSAGAVTSFIPTLVATFGFSRITTLLLIAPPYLVAALTGLLVSYSSDRMSERGYHIIIPVIFGMSGFALFAVTLNYFLRYLSLFLMLAGIYGSYNVALAWISSCIPAPREKRSAAIAIINTSGNLAQIYSPYLYLKKNGPRYTGAMVADSMFCLACVGFVWMLRKRLKRENDEMEKIESMEGSADDMADGYRYIL